MKKTKITIDRINPPVSKRKKFSISEILEAATKVRKALKKEEAKYGKSNLAGI